MLGSRTRASTLVRFVIATVVVIACVTVAVVVAGLLAIKSSLVQPTIPGPVPVTAPSPGKPETILLIGSDHRAGEPFRDSRTDTMMLMHLDGSSSTINVLSVPRDLEVSVPDGGTTTHQKLNAAYSIGGPALLLKVLKTQVFPGLEVNHVVDVNFGGFAQVVNALGCVYADVDHRYYNDTAQTDYSSIDVPAGYERLCGTKALQFVRFRHTDSDLVREARQQDFVRWAKDQYSTGEIVSQHSKLLKIFTHNATTDRGLKSVDQLIDLFDLVAFSAGHTIKQVPFPAEIQPCTITSCYVTATRGAESRVLKTFLTPTTSAPAAPAKTGTAPNRQTAAPAPGGPVPGLVADPADGRAQAEALGTAGMKVMYPTQIVAGTDFCSSITGNCNEAPNPASEYIGAYPRQYRLRDLSGAPHAAYRMTLVKSSGLGEYYGVEGTTWRTPPILQGAHRTVDVDGKALREYFDGGKLTMVAWVTAAGAYWVSNTLTEDIPNRQLVGIAASLRPIGG